MPNSFHKLAPEYGDTFEYMIVDSKNELSMVIRLKEKTADTSLPKYSSRLRLKKLQMLNHLWIIWNDEQ